MFKPALRALFMALCLALPLAACAWDGLTARQDADLRAVYEKMRVNDISGIEAAFDPQFRTAPLHQNLSFMQGMIPPQASAGRLLKGLILKDKGHTDYGGLYEYDYPSTAVLAQIEMREDPAGRKTVIAVHLQQAAVGIDKSYAFGLTGKKPFQYAFLFLVVLSPLLGIWGLIALARAPDIKWKFIWGLAMMVGFMDLTMDWHTGDVFLKVQMIHPLWLSASRFGPLSPWMISTSFPLAAVAFLLGYRPTRLARPWDGKNPKV